MSRPTRNEILELDVGERLRLIEEIWETIAADPDGLPVTDEERLEIDQRLKDLEEHPDDQAPWPEVKERLLRGLDRS